MIQQSIQYIKQLIPNTESPQLCEYLQDFQISVCLIKNRNKGKDMKSLRCLIIPLFLSLLLTACNNSSGSTTSDPFYGMHLATLSVDASGQPSTTSTPLPENTILIDDFNDPTTGWQTQDDDYGKATFENGSFIIEARQNGQTMWSTYDQTFSDVEIDVDVTALGSSQNENNGFGVDCRIQDNGDGYTFHISSDGMYSILKFEDTHGSELVKWTESLNIPTGDKTNHLTVLCQGSHLGMWVNDISIASIEDTTFTTGSISLSATTFTDLPTTVKFDNLVLTNPGSTGSVQPTGTANLAINNPTKETVCSVYIIDPSSETWGQNLLGENETILPGESKAIADLPSGLVDIEVDNCEYLRLLNIEGFDLANKHEVTIAEPNLLKEWEFASSQSDWPIADLVGGRITLTNDDYLSFSVVQEKQVVVSHSNYAATDTWVRSEMMIVNAGNEDQAIYGVMCRVQPDGSGIFFAIRADGFASIQKVSNGSLTPLLDWSQDDWINTGIDSNVIEGDCIGSEYKMFVNGEYIGKGEDNTFVSGNIGLAGFSLSGTTQADFDYVRVYKAE